MERLTIWHRAFKKENANKIEETENNSEGVKFRTDFSNKSS